MHRIFHLITVHDTQLYYQKVLSPCTCIGVYDTDSHTYSVTNNCTAHAGMYVAVHVKAKNTHQL